MIRAKENIMSKKVVKNLLKSFVMVLVLSVFSLGLTACGEDDKEDAKNKEKVKVNLFIAASLSGAMDEIKADFEKENPDVEVLINADSSGKLKAQIQEGFECDIFFSASPKEVDELEALGLIVKDSKVDLLENQLAIIAHKDYEGSVKGLDTLSNAESVALAYGSVPVGFYARKAMISDGILAYDKNLEKEEVKAISGQIVSTSLGGNTISEKENVSTVVSAVAEKSTEVGFSYVSDIKRNKDIKIIQKIDTQKTGKIIYPVVKIESKAAKDKADKDKNEAVDKLFKYLNNKESKKKYEKYGFLTK